MKRAVLLHYKSFSAQFSINEQRSENAINIETAGPLATAMR